MDNTLELGDTVQGSMMLGQFEQNMVLTYTKGQRTMTAIAEALLEQHCGRTPSWARETYADR